jgi:glycosyltransferase involved in cell wall biosynthesis
MRIAIDATPLLMRSSGVKNYVYYWIRSLQQLAGARTISAFPFLGPLPELNHEGSAMGYWETRARLAFVFASNCFRVPILNLAVFGLDVFHMSNIFVRNPPTNTRRTVTLHDMTCWLVPEFHTPANVAASKHFAERVARRVDGLIAVSESTRNDAVRLLDLKPDRIQVIYSGVAEAFFQVTEADVTAARARQKLARPYVLYVGTIEPRKNLDTLLDAWQQLAPSLREEYELILAGPVGWGNASVVPRAQALCGVRYISYVPEADLAGITAGATAFAYPSLYEGFGFPVAQALAAGVPVLTSNVSSMPEVTGPAAVLIDPRSAGEVAAGLEKLLSSPSMREKLSREGRLRAERFRWEECARKSLAFFQGVIGNI